VIEAKTSRSPSAVITTRARPGLTGEGQGEVGTRRVILECEPSNKSAARGRPLSRGAVSPLDIVDFHWGTNESVNSKRIVKNWMFRGKKICRLKRYFACQAVEC
jgi:hypothetical protein